MIKKLIFALLLGVFGPTVMAGCSFKFTKEQDTLLHLSYAIGEPHDLGYTMAALAWQEGFVGPHIVRINPNDGKHGSYGVTHVLLTTAMWLEGVDSVWVGKAELVPKLINDDIYTLHMSLRYLLRFDHLPWKKQVERYNGQGPMAEAYAEKVSIRVNRLVRCKYFNTVVDNQNNTH